jgi:hypothetical protein
VAMIHVDARRLSRRRIQPSPPLMGVSAELFSFELRSPHRIGGPARASVFKTEEADPIGST